MMNSEAMLEAAEKHTSQERSAMIAAAQTLVQREGSEVCVECDRPIPADRRAAAPFALRCVMCESTHEKERPVR